MEAATAAVMVEAAVTGVAGLADTTLADVDFMAVGHFSMDTGRTSSMTMIGVGLLITMKRLAAGSAQRSGITSIFVRGSPTYADKTADGSGRH